VAVRPWPTESSLSSIAFKTTSCVGYLTRFGHATYHTSERDTIWGKRGRTRPRQRWPRIGPWRALSVSLSLCLSVSLFARAQPDNIPRRRHPSIHPSRDNTAIRAKYFTEQTTQPPRNDRGRQQQQQQQQSTVPRGRSSRMRNFLLLTPWSSIVSWAFLATVRGGTEPNYDSNVCRPGSKRARSLSRARALVARLHRCRDW